MIDIKCFLSFRIDIRVKRPHPLWLIYIGTLIQLYAQRERGGATTTIFFYVKTYCARAFCILRFYLRQCAQVITLITKRFIIIRIRRVVKYSFLIGLLKAKKGSQNTNTLPRTYHKFVYCIYVNR